MSSESNRNEVAPVLKEAIEKLLKSDKIPEEQKVQALRKAWEILEIEGRVPGKTEHSIK